MITLYGFGRVEEIVIGITRDLRVQWALEELELPYQLRGLNHFAGDLETDEYQRLSPFAQVPTIVDDGFVLVETGAILLYLAEKAGRLIPSDIKGRAQVTRWCFAAVNTVEPTFLQIVAIDFAGARDPTGAQRRPELIRLAQRWLTALEGWLAKAPYLTGNEFTVADLLMTTVLREIRTTELLAGFPCVDAFRERCEKRPAWQRTLDAYENRLGAAQGSAR